MQLGSQGDLAQPLFEFPALFPPAMPEGILFLNRLQFGFYSVLARLDVEADYASVEASFLDDAVAAIDGLSDTKTLPRTPPG